MKKIKEYFKNKDQSQIYEDFYAATFIVAGVVSMIYIAVRIARYKV